MEPLTTIRFSGVELMPEIGKKSNLCAISKKNLIAFSAPKCYKERKLMHVNSTQISNTSASTSSTAAADEDSSSQLKAKTKDVE